MDSVECGVRQKVLSERAHPGGDNWRKNNSYGFGTVAEKWRR